MRGFTLTWYTSSTQTFSSSSFSSSSSELLSDGGAEDRLFVTSSSFGFTALFFLPRGFLLRELAYRAEETSVSVTNHWRANEGMYELVQGNVIAYFTCFLRRKLYPLAKRGDIGFKKYGNNCNKQIVGGNYSERLTVLVRSCEFVINHWKVSWCTGSKLQWTNSVDFITLNACELWTKTQEALKLWSLCRKLLVIYVCFKWTEWNFVDCI